MHEVNTAQFANRFLAGYGIAECPLEVAVERISQPQGDREAPLRVVGSTPDVLAALEFLSVLSVPATRHVAWAAGRRHTALINNHRNGSDYADQRVWLARHLRTRFARIVAQPESVWSNGSDRVVMRYAATIFELYSPEGELIRAVNCMNDGGRWTFHEAGERQPVEAGFPYDARRIRDRFRSEHLQQLAGALAMPTLGRDEITAAGKFYLLQSVHPETNTCTLAEADDPAYLYYLRGLTWVSRMETHATSVVADFERCVQLNPDYEPKVRDWLNQAYRVLGSEQ